MPTLPDIKHLDDVKIMVDHFYTKVRMDDLLKDIFNNTIQNRWPEHLEKMYRFWQTVLLDEHSYAGSPFLPHAKLPVHLPHFERWLKLFDETVDEHFEGPNADKAKWQGKRMADMFHSKIDFYRNNPNSPLL